MSEKKETKKKIPTDYRKAEIDLRLKEMEQRERQDNKWLELENKRLDWEMARHVEDKEDQKQLYGLIAKALDGPVADLTRNLGSAVAKRLEINTPSKEIGTVKIKCLNCLKYFPIIVGQPMVVCPYCEAISKLDC